MTGIAIYMEGGGDSTHSKDAIRLGMSEFLRQIRDRARARRWEWKVVACGSGRAARDAFINARARSPGLFNVLLVDSEGPVSGTPRAHLIAHGWTLDGGDGCFHLMAQTMETWIVADVDALKAYYRQGFLENALPKAVDLEVVAKADVQRALEHATKETQKGAYHKINHASALLAKIDPEKVRERCCHCRQLFEVLTTQLDVA